MPRGGPRPGSGRKPGKFGPYVRARELEKRVVAVMAEQKLDLIAALAYIVEDVNCAVPTRMLALRHIGHAALGKFARMVAAEGISLERELFS